MSEQDDRIFIKHFSWIITGLVIFTIAIALFAMNVHGKLAPSENPSREARIEDRLKPTASVYEGEAGQSQIEEEQSLANTSTPAPFDGSLDGGLLYDNVCAACHNTGATNAPTLVADAWTERLTKGDETLYQSAVSGIGVMPAKGGRVDLSDEQVKAAVDYMLGQVR